MPYDITATMEKAVGALRVLQTFWSSNESEQHGHRGSAQASPTLQASPATETPTSRLWHPKVKLEEGGEEVVSNFSESHWTQAPEIREHNDRSTGEPPNVTGQNTDNTTQRASTSRDSPERASREESGPRNTARSDVPYTDLSFEMPPETEARHATSPSPQPSTHDSNEETQDSVIVATGNSSQPSAGHPGERPGNQGKGYVAPRVDRKWYLDEEVRDQPDIIFADGTLTMPLDGPQLREVLHKIEQDRLLCFKMRWYVARHVRRQYQADLMPSVQLYRRRVNRKQRFARKTGIVEHPMSLRDKPFNRLDFEATRLQENFFRNQPGWHERSITRILQTAYEQYRWEETVTEENVDQVLVMQAGADLRAFAAAGRMSRAYHGSPLNKPSQDVLRAIEAEARINASSSSVVRGAATTPGQSKLPAEPVAQRTPQGPPSSTPLLQDAGAGTVTAAAAPKTDEISQLRAEISELKAEVEKGRKFRESYAEEQRASQEALMAEMRMMLEAAECGRNQKRKRGSGSRSGSGSGDHHKKQLSKSSKSSKRKSKKLRKYVRKLKELDVHTEESLSSSSSSSAEDAPSDSE